MGVRWIAIVTETGPKLYYIGNLELKVVNGADGELLANISAGR